MRAAIALSALLAVAPLSGCAKAGDTLPRDEIVAQADAICLLAQQKIRAMPKPRNADALAAWSRRAAAIEREAARDVRALPASRELAPAVATVADIYAADAVLRARNARAAERRDFQGLREVGADSFRLGRRAQAAQERLGTTKCARSSR